MGRPGQSKYQGQDTMGIVWHIGSRGRDIEISGPKKCAHLYILANIYKPLSVLLLNLLRISIEEKNRASPPTAKTHLNDSLSQLSQEN